MELWTTVLFLALDALVKPGGPCDGAIVVHQEDNAGPHIDKVYKTWLQEQFNIRGWKLEHQAPQGPYTNVLDLQMFPAMIKRHSKLLQMYSNNEANFSSPMVSRAFIHAYRIMATIIENDGHNHWLVNGTPHCMYEGILLTPDMELPPDPFMTFQCNHS
jgi:hypothetical protein